MTSLEILERISILESVLQRAIQTELPPIMLSIFAAFCFYNLFFYIFILRKRLENSLTKSAFKVFIFAHLVVMGYSYTGASDEDVEKLVYLIALYENKPPSVVSREIDARSGFTKYRVLYANLELRQVISDEISNLKMELANRETEWEIQRFRQSGGAATLQKELKKY